MDGEHFYTVNIESDDKAEFHTPQHITLNLAVGGNWPGSPDENTLSTRYAAPYVYQFQHR